MIWEYIAAIAAVLILITLSGCNAPLSPNASPGNTAQTIKPSRGVIEGNVYTNEYAGIKFTAPADWNYATDNDMVSLFGADADTMGEPGKEFTEAMLKSDAVYDMFVISNTTLNSAAVLFQNMEGVDFDEAQYFSLLKLSLKSDGAVFHDITDGNLGSQNYKVMQYDSEDSNQYYYARKIDNIMVCMILTAFKGTDISSVTDCFS